MKRKHSITHTRGSSLHLVLNCKLKSNKSVCKKSMNAHDVGCYLDTSHLLCTQVCPQLVHVQFRQLFDNRIIGQNGRNPNVVKENSN